MERLGQVIISGIRTDLRSHWIMGWTKRKKWTRELATSRKKNFADKIS